LFFCGFHRLFGSTLCYHFSNSRKLLYFAKTINIKDMDILEIIELGETSRVQFKREFDNQDKITAELIALANSKGGMLLFGVEDKTGEVVGMDYQKIQQVGNKISTVANELVNPPVFIMTEVVSVSIGNAAKKVLIVYVEEGVNKPYKDNNGTIWMKQGTDKRKLKENAEIMRLFQQSGNLSADEMAVFGTCMDDIDDRYFAEYFKKEFNRSFQEMKLTYKEALLAKKVLIEDKVTLAGLLFFGKEPQKFKPAFTIKLVSFAGNNMASQHYRNKPEDVKGSIPELFKQGMLFFFFFLRYRQNGQGFNSIGIPEISSVALEEVLQNALIHRDYFKNAPVRVLIFDNRIEIISPGKLPNGLTVEDIKYGNIAIRNHQIASYSVHVLPYSGLGSGLKRALELQPDMTFINDEAGEQFTVIFPRQPE
jgi:predicted HTH transcriptional regulator